MRSPYGANRIRRIDYAGRVGIGCVQLGDTRWAQLVTELVHIPVDIVVVETTSAALAAKEATSTIPIVALVVSPSRSSPGL